MFLPASGKISQDNVHPEILSGCSDSEFIRDEVLADVFESFKPTTK